jgi:hypothetical protein
MPRDTIALIELRESASIRQPLHAYLRFDAYGGGHNHPAELFVGRDRLDDPEYVVAVAVDAVAKIVRGQLPPGTVDYF